MNETPTDWKLETPSVTLYAFHLCHDITSSSQQVRDNADRLWEQCVTFGEQRHILPLKTLKSSLRSYSYSQKDRQYYYTPTNEDKEATEAEKSYLDSRLELVRLDPKLNKARQLHFHSEREENGHRLWGENPTQRRHILVWLNTNPETQKQLQQGEVYQTFYHALLNLLCCRSKILYAYHQSRLCDRAAKGIYNELEAQIKTLATPSQETLEELKQWLKQTPLRVLEYGKLLRDIEDHRNAIATNTKNYRAQLDKIKSICVEEDNLEFLENFLNSTSKYFQAQIQVDLRYLTPAQTLFQQTVDTIRGIVAIEAEEQAQVREQKDKERDRNLQTTIAVVGVGIGVAGLAATASPYLIPPDPQTPKIPLQPPFSSRSLHPLISVMLLSLVCGFVGAGVAKLVTMLIQQRSDNRAKLEGRANKKHLNSANTPIVEPVTGVPQKAEIPTATPRK